MENSDEQVIISEKTESKHELRPCYLMLRGLALWQPKKANKVYRFYNICGYIFLICLVGFVLFSFSEKSIAKEKLLWKSVLNGVIFSATFAVAFFCTKWHYCRGRYSAMIAEIKQDDMMEYLHCRKLVRHYTIAALTLWIFCSCQLLWFFYSAMETNQWWYWILYFFVAVFGNGKNFPDFNLVLLRLCDSYHVCFNSWAPYFESLLFYLTSTYG